MDVADVLTGRQQVKDPVGDRVQKLFQDFLSSFKEDDDQPKYLEEAQNLIKPERNTLEISFKDVQTFNQNLAESITEEFFRVYPYLCNALRNFVKDQAEVEVPNKEYYVSLYDVPTRLKVRELSTAKVGTLIRISGQVVRTHPVHPELVRGTFKCLDCQATIKDIPQQFKYTQPTLCTNPVCFNRTRFDLDTHLSKFVDFQKIRIQETQAELPRGSIPRSLEVIVRAESVEHAQAGDKCDFVGTLIVVPDVGALNMPGARAETASRHKASEKEENEGLQGLKALGVRELHYRLAFLANNLETTNKTLGGSGEWSLRDVNLESLKRVMPTHEWEKLFEMSVDKNLYGNLVNSLFPTIHGNEEVKRGVLLMLFGGVPKTTEEGTTLRGDINVCIVGDPSTAKSQVLRQVAEFCPRAVYTSGKASSAAGLTAAVVKDEESYEFVIEAGALMLADNGVCCIDEFDKMDPKDQVAIHEAMEQQTISITKAGIKATLNARTSILAAANPIGGRYDRGKSLRQNIQMGAPIMSRFDLFFILIDDANEVTDYAIARKIVDLHSRGKESVDRMYSQAEVLKYIMFARQFKPTLTNEAAKQLVEYYKTLRMRDTGGSSRTAWRITVRQLESLIRLSEAYARMRCCDKIIKAHVDEAFRLLNKSIIRVEQPDIYFGDEDDEVMNADDEDEVDDIEPSQPVNQHEEEDEPPMDRMDIDEDLNPLSPRPVQKKKLKLNYDQYKSMSNLIVMYMRREESRMEDEGVETEGLRRNQVVNWYLDEIQDEIESEQELIEKKELVEKVIDRLIHHDNVIIPLMEGQEEEEDPIIVVHPNYVIDF